MNRTLRVKRVRVSAAAALLLFAATGARTTSAQTPTASQLNTKVALKKLVDAANNLSPEVRKHLSPALQNYLRYANAVVNAPAAAPITNVAPQIFASPINPSSPVSATAAADPNLIQVSNLSMDPPKQGYTQNTTSSAWCGNSVVVGYQDTGAFVRTDPTQASGVPISLNGVSFSTNAGKTFTDLGFLTPGTASGNALLGDPVVTCTSPTNFQYVSILNTLGPDGANPVIGPSISFSTDAGKTWSAPQQIVSLDGTTEIADKPWLAVDPYNPHHMYVTYTHASLGCTNVEIVRSSDAGKTWSAPAALNSDCANPNIVMNTGSNVVVSPGGKVYVAYESFPVPPNGASFGKTAIYFTRSLSAGASFSAPIKISDVVPGGDGVYLNGPIQANDYPQLAVDRSTGPSRGTIYLTWPDGRNRIVPRNSAPSGNYAYPDIFVAKSTNLGLSFKVLGAISPTPKSFPPTSGRDQFLPTIAVDNDAEVAVCYYDRRNDPNNLRVARFCSISANQGKTWTDTALSRLDWVPVPNSDPLSLLLGGATDISEYDAVASEFLLHTDGFFASFTTEQTGKQSVVAKKF
jgi:hypothetical protein